MVANLILTQFRRRLAALRRVRLSAENAISRRAIKRTDLNHIYESTFLQAVSAFETFQEELFYACLLGRSGMSRVSPSIAFRNRSEAERVLLGGDRKAFLSWSNMKSTIDRGEAYLVGGRPFVRLRRRGNELAVLDSVTKIRNAIAHDSGVAKEKFRALGLGGLPPRRRTPAGYLQQRTGHVTKHEALLDEVERIALALAATTEKAAQKLLRDEDSYRTGAGPIKGIFECTACRTTFKLSRVASLGRCTSCNAGPCSHCGNWKANEFKRLSV